MEEDPMKASSRPDRRRRRVARGVYRQPNGKYAVCVRVDGRARFRTLEAATLIEALMQRELLQEACRLGELPLSPRFTFAESRLAGSPTSRRRSQRVSGAIAHLIT